MEISRHLDYDLGCISSEILSGSMETLVQWGQLFKSRLAINVKFLSKLSSSLLIVLRDISSEIFS